MFMIFGLLIAFVGVVFASTEAKTKVERYCAYFGIVLIVIGLLMIVGECAYMFYWISTQQ